jgi:hypothetical protein
LLKNKDLISGSDHWWKKNDWMHDSRIEEVLSRMSKELSDYNLMGRKKVVGKIDDIEFYDANEFARALQV